VLRRPVVCLALLALLAAAGCGGGGDDDTKGPEQTPPPNAQTCPPETGAVLADAKERMTHDDFDGAFAVMKKAADCPRVQAKLAQYKPIAAKQTLKNARRQLASAHRRQDSPQAAVSLARNSLKYQDTPEARAVLAQALKELNAWKREHGPKPDEEATGPPAGAGEGGPPAK
jgi:hypothetical protein